MRSGGASKQVAREAVAAARRRTLDKLVEWYTYGWHWFGVTCDFEILGESFEAALWGIDDEDYAEKDVVPEIADEVAHQLEEADDYNDQIADAEAEEADAEENDEEYTGPTGDQLEAEKVEKLETMIDRLADDF